MSSLADLSPKVYTAVLSGVHGKYYPTLWQTPSSIASKARLDANRDGRKVCIDRSYISDMERGKKNVCLPTLDIIAKALDQTIAKILRGI